jgi:hypothetical protein
MISHGREKRKGYAWIPRDFDFGQFGTQAERCARLASELYGRTLWGDQDFADWVPLPKSYLERLLTRRNYKIVLEKSLDAGLIQFAERWNYAAGHHCRHFRLGRRFRHREWGIAELDSSPTVWTLDDLPSDAYRWAAESALRVSILNVPQVAIAKEATRKAAESKLSQSELRQLYAQRVAAVRAGIMRPIVDEHGRLYTGVTNLNGCFRSLLRLGGEPLAGWDIRTSQPLWLGLLVAEQGTDYHPLAGQTGVNTETHKGVIRASSLVPRSSGALPWLRCVVSGDLYDLLRSESGLVHLSRVQIKIRVFTVLYGANLSDTDPVLLAMQRLFPDVVDFIFRVKDVARLRAVYWRLRRSHPYLTAKRLFEREYRPVYARLACALQEREAQFIFGGVVPRLMENGVPAVTIHDSVLTRRREADVVKEVMHAEFRRIGVAAQLHKVSYDGVGEGVSGGDGSDPGVRDAAGEDRLRPAECAAG